MKDLITTAASILLLMIFVLQFAGNQVTHIRVFQSGLAVESFREELKAEGFPAAASIKQLKNALASICGCGTDEISVDISEGEAWQTAGRRVISYEVGFPLQNLIVLGSALGISPEENCVNIKEKGWVLTAYEEPDHHPGTDSSDDHGNHS